MNRFDILINLFHRKGTKELILSILYRLILDKKENPFYIILFFRYMIVLEINAKFKVEFISDKKLAKKELKESNIPLEVPKPFNIMLSKKNYISQIDFLINLFAKFEKDMSKNDKEKNIQTLLSRVIFYMLQFFNEINRVKMELKPFYNTTILKYIKKANQNEELIQYMIHKNIPDSFELGIYFLELSENKMDKNWKIFEYLGLKILAKLKKHENLLNFYLKNGNIVRAMNYLNEIFEELTYEQLNNLFTNNKEIIEKNSDLILLYLQ